MVFDFKRKAPIIKNGSKVSKGDTTAMLMIFIGVILAVVLIQPIADTENQATNTITITNATVELPTDVDGGTLDVTGRDFVSLTEIINSTNASQSYTVNVTLTDGIGSVGAKSVILTINGTNAGVDMNGTDANISYVANPDGFVAGGGGSLLAVTIIFLALAGVIFVLIVLVRRGVFRNIGNKVFGRK